MADDIIDAEVAQPEQLPCQQNAIAIIPGTVPGSHIPGYIATSGASPRPILFIGGPLDGKVVDICADGRLYEHQTESEPGSGFFDGEMYRYCPTVISLAGKATVVYILESHVLRGEIAEERRLGDERTAITGNTSFRSGRIAPNTVRRISDGQ